MGVKTPQTKKPQTEKPSKSNSNKSSILWTCLFKGILTKKSPTNQKSFSFLQRKHKRKESFEVNHILQTTAQLVYNSSKEKKESNQRSLICVHCYMNTISCLRFNMHFVFKTPNYAYLPEPPNSNMSICSKRYIQKVLICGKRPRREIAGKQYKNTKERKRSFILG